MYKLSNTLLLSSFRSTTNKSHLGSRPSGGRGHRAFSASPPEPEEILNAPVVSSRVLYDKKQYPPPLIVNKSGVALLGDPIYNKGTGYPHGERDRLKIRGLVPPRYFSIEQQVQRVMNRYHSLKTNLEKNVYLTELQDRNETIFYRVLMDNIDSMARIIYTPTVGEACLKFGHQYRRPRGMFFSSLDRGEMHAMVHNWLADDVEVIVVTDGSRILGLGDLGAHGMGIPIGKVALYVAGGGIHPARVLPITIDIGTNNEALLRDPFYLGMNHRRLKGDEYFSFIEEFLSAVYTRWPKVLVQFEDFENSAALPILEKYRDRYLCFNDDIQGTGSVTLGGLLCALRAQNLPPAAIKSQRIVCLGAGSAGLGVCNTIAMAMREEGLSDADAHKQFWLVDKDGLLGKGRRNTTSAQDPYVRKDVADGTSLLEVIKQVKPTILLGLSGVGGMFKEEHIREMYKHCKRPVIFPLSNPTKNAECTAEQAFRWTNGSAIFASGSPFDPVQMDGRTFYPTQGNNMFIFPGIGLGVVASRAKKVTDRMFYVAAQTLAKYVTEEDLKNSRVYPDMIEIRQVSKSIAVEVAKLAISEGLSRLSRPPEDVEAFIAASQYDPSYAPLILKRKG